MPGIRDTAYNSLQIFFDIEQNSTITDKNFTILNQESSEKK